MITSMTGFGSAEKITENYSLKVEIRTLNSKFFDPSFKLAKEFVAWEIEIKSLLEKGLNRGKVNLVIEFQPKVFMEAPVQINEDLFQVYYDKLVKLAQRADSTTVDIFKIATAMPNVITSKEDISSYIKPEELKEVISQAIDKCKSYRSDEGDKLKVALIASKDQIEQGLETVESLDPDRIENVKNRIQGSLAELGDSVKIDENRFEQELIYYIEKLDITEEKVRLASHLAYFDEVMNQSQPSGKKLGFLAQELGREINTIGSKANDAGIQRAVVGMKEELEKIKEQILNVL